MDKMSEREWKRLDGVERVQGGLLSNGEAAAVLGISARQMRRVRERVGELGHNGVQHGNTGRAPVNRVGEQVRARVVELRLDKYTGFNDQHFTEKLAEVEGLVLSRATVRRMLRAAGISSKRQRRAPVHRRRRARRAQAGMMILWDGSQHPWLEERGPQLCLMGALDDATGELLEGAHFVVQECAAGYLGVLKAIAASKGLPWSAYMDHHSSLFRNDDHWSAQERERGVQTPTQVGQALAALGIVAIPARSPQAKGRVERLWRTLQDRLVAELRLAAARTLAQANTVLKRFIFDYNRRFARPAAIAEAAWRPLPEGLDLERVCSFGYQATVLNDNTVRLSGLVIDIAPGPQQRSYARARVEVRQLLDGSWRVYHHQQLIATAPSTAVGELRALKGRYHWAPPAAPARRPKANSATAAAAAARAVPAPLTKPKAKKAKRIG
jgi:transposase